MWFLDGGDIWRGGNITCYLASDVDELLRRVAAELDAGRPARPLIEKATFQSATGKRGYHIDAVDWFLDQLLLPQDHGETGETSADPWSDVGDVAQLVRGGVSGLAQRYPPPQKPTRRKALRWFAGECENAWRDFGEQPGIQL
jgi:DivIVA domain-containing protein